MCSMGNMELLCMEFRGFGPHLLARGSLMVYSELLLEKAVYSRVSVDMAIQNSCFFSDIRTLV